jgi:hypothetical protein
MQFQPKFDGNIQMRILRYLCKSESFFTTDFGILVSVIESAFILINFLYLFQSSFGGRVDFDFSNLQTEAMQQWLGFLSPDAISVELEGSLLQRVTPDLASDPSLQTFVRNIFVQGLSSMKDPLR